MSEQAVGIAAKLYQCRKSALFLLGHEKFKAKVAEWEPIIMKVMADQGCDAVRASMILAERLEANGHDGMPTMMLFGVCVEMLEPTPGLAESV